MRQTRPEGQSHTQVTIESPEERERSLRLIGQNTQPTERPNERPRVTWSEETVDNEHLNRKKSKICCIFHPKDEDLCESSEEEEYSSPSSSSSSSESESDSDSPSGSRPHHHRRTTPRPNAYERQPKLKSRRHVH